jgi:exodeoxyribonuclease VII large subunit
MNNGFVILSVSQLNLYVRSLLEADKNLSSVFLRGEISNFTNHYRSGHFYLSLKDENSVIKAIMFKSNAQKLLFLPRDGMKVIVTGRASLYDRDGQYQFYIDDMQPDGVGALHIAFEQLKEKLRAQGLFDEERKKPLPVYPSRIGVITSPTGAALQDILNILKRRWPVAEVILYPVLVQGQEAPAQICRAIVYLNDMDACDVIIAGRGGGSLEELWAFNDEGVAVAIAASHIPLVSAVGHETDFTIADFVADLRAPTPSAAAEMVSPDRQAVAAYIQDLKSVMETQMKRRVTELRSRYNTAVSSKALLNPMNAIELQRMKLDLLYGRAATAEKYRVSNARGAFAILTGKLDSLSPLKVLSRGYAIPSHADGTLIKSAGEFSDSEEFSLRLSGGTAGCRVITVEMDKQIENLRVKQP